VSAVTPAHTPGPWRFDRTNGSIVGPDNKPVAYASAARIEAEANGDLIAVAPDLLASLQPLLAHAKQPCQSQAVLAVAIAAAEAAIAKVRAEGAP
jgi:hypothetical protein